MGSVAWSHRHPLISCSLSQCVDQRLSGVWTLLLFISFELFVHFLPDFDSFLWGRLVTFPNIISNNMRGTITDRGDDAFISWRCQQADVAATKRWSEEMKTHIRREIWQRRKRATFERLVAAWLRENQTTSSTGAHSEQWDLPHLQPHTSLMMSAANTILGKRCQPSFCYRILRPISWKLIYVSCLYLIRVN